MGIAVGQVGGVGSGVGSQFWMCGRCQWSLGIWSQFVRTRIFSTDLMDW
jgi:Mn2+/Fe2+ NRAMP family transporter